MPNRDSTKGLSLGGPGPGKQLRHMVVFKQSLDRFRLHLASPVIDHLEACLIRYTDDFVCAFERADAADRFMVDLETRLEKFGLRLSRTKTRKLQFPRTGDGRASFDFLGFEFRWGRDRRGRPHLKRRTARKSLRASFCGGASFI